MFEFTEVSFDQIALTIDVRGDRALYLAIALGRDMGCGTHGLDLFNQGAGIITPVGDEMAQAFQAGDQTGGGRVIGYLALRQGETDRQALGIDHGMQLGTQSPTRETNGVIRAPFLPPLACW